MSEHFGGDDRQEKLKQIVQELHDGAEVATVRKRFAALIKNVSPQEIAKMEQSLIADGVPVEKVQRMCDVHVAAFEESLKRQKKQKTLPGHPIRTFVDENKEMRRSIKRVRTAAKSAVRRGSWETVSEELARLRLVELHYSRKENLLFPLLESEKFTGPSKVMWGKHDEIRGMFKDAEAGIKSQDRSRLMAAVAMLARSMRKMAFMEERILFPTALKMLSDSQWARIRKGESEIGYAWIKPGNLWDANIVAARAMADSLGTADPAQSAAGGAAAPAGAASSAGEGRDTAGEIPLDVGAMSGEMVNLLLKNIPLDMTYVDENDRVRYYSQGKERIFPRTPAIIGREVQNCHPPKSVHVVEQIVADFRAKKREVAEFWLEMGGKFIHIRYFPLFDNSGDYRGVLEVSQDVTAIRGLEGQKRLLD